MAQCWRSKGWRLGLANYWAIAGALAQLSVGVIFSENYAFAQIKPDRTLGAEPSVIKSNVNIKGLSSDRIEGGARRGTNLFHSFREFNIDEGHGAYFTNPAGIENILGRVTGNDASNILGTLGVIGGKANLFLINPNGIVFGPNSSLDVEGSFVGTTANAIQFDQQGFFSASAPDAPPLLTVNPSAFLFNQIAAQSITNQSVTGLQVPAGESLLLLGGDVNLDSGTLLAPGGRVELGGVAGTGTVGLNVDGSNLDLSFPDQVARADVSLTNRAIVNVAAGGGGSIAVNARNLDISGGSGFEAGMLTNLGSLGSKAGDIEINATDGVKIAGETSAPSGIANTVGDDLQDTGALGSTGDVIINTGSLEVIGNAQISSYTNGQGNAGRVTITARDRVSSSGGGILSTVGPSGMGNGADITITARSLDLSDSSLLFTGTFAQGNSGNIQINATDSVSVGSGSSLSAFSVGQGDAGNIVLNAPDATVSFDGFKVLDNGSFRYTGASTFVGIGKEFFNGSLREFVGTGQSGDITVTAKSLSVTNGAQLSTSTSGQIGPDGKLANAGNILVNAADFVTVSGGSQLKTNTVGGGNAGNVTIDAPEATLSFNGVGSINKSSPTGEMVFTPPSSGIFSIVNPLPGFKDDRQGGNITVKARSLSLTNGAQLAASTFGRGNAGDVSVDVGNGTATFDGADFTSGSNSGIFSNADSGAIGNAGTIDLKAGSLSLTNGAQVLTAVREFRRLPDGTILPPGQGNGGMININASDIALDGSSFNQIGAESPSGIFSTIYDGATGIGGTINVQADSLTLSNNAVIDSTLRLGAVGKGGDINISKLRSFSATNGAQVNTSTLGKGDAGNLIIAAERLSIRDAAQVSASTWGTGDGGNLIVTADVIELTGRTANGRFSSGLFASTLGDGDAGNLTVAVERLTVQDGAAVTVSSQGSGDAGNLEIASRSILLDNQGKLIAESASGQGGSITLQAQDLLLLRRSSQISTTAGTSQAGGDGGNINIDTNFLVAVPSENSDITANAFKGRGGNVQINTQGIFGIKFQNSPTLQSDITASSQFGVQGTVDINTPDVDPSQGLVALPEELVDASGLIAQGCPAGEGPTASRFVVTGRGGLPPSPEEALSTDAVVTGLVTLDSDAKARSSSVSSTPSSQNTPAALIETRGWVMNNQGEVMLTAQAPTSAACDAP